MTRKKKSRVPPPPVVEQPIDSPPAPPVPEDGIPTEPEAEPGLRRVTILITEADERDMHLAFSEHRTASVTAHAPLAPKLSAAQRDKRRAYRQRPEVREKNILYRKARAKRIRDAKRLDGK